MVLDSVRWWYIQARVRWCRYGAIWRQMVVATGYIGTCDFRSVQALVVCETTPLRRDPAPTPSPTPTHTPTSTPTRNRAGLLTAGMSMDLDRIRSGVVRARGTDRVMVGL